MSHLQLTCLGDFRVTLGGAPLTGFQTDKMRALLIYLALEGQPHSRSDLTRFLWPGYQEESARNSFRQYLHQLRQLLRNDDSDPPWLLVTRQTVQFNPAAPLEVDVARFTGLLAQTRAHAHAQLSTCQPCLARLREAVGLYGGDFLAGFTVADSDPFEEWRRIRQEQLHLQTLDALTHLADAAEAAGESEQALHDAQRQLALEPWLESAHRRIMRILARRKQVAAAVAQYQLCSQVLASELGVAPEAETIALYDQIRSGAFDKGTKPAPTPPVTSSSLHDWGEMPGVEGLQGRSSELMQLAGWLGLQENDAQRQPCRLVAVLGMGGTGKSTVVAALTKTVAPMFEVVIWRSLLNAPPPAEVIAQWLQVLTRQTLHTLPDSLTEQVRLLLEHLRRQRCLLVLDNLESVLQPDTAGAMRPGYEGYGQLLQQVGGTTHQSVLLLTSREQPHVLTRLLGANSPVRLLPLAGLDAGAGHALLQTHGLKASAADAHALVTHYSGNPLALQLVAQTVQDLFAGQIAPFLAVGAPIFDDIRSVLDQQYARLSPLEGEILRWLALERRPITLPTLRDNLLQPPPIHRLLEAVRALQRRSLLEIVGEGFTLQNVVMEYVTEQLVEGICAEVAAQSPDGGIPQSLFNRHALLNAQSNEFVRVSQARLILQPIAERLLQEMGESRLTERLQQILADLRAQTRGSTVVPGYTAGNILNLLLHIGTPERVTDFSHLAVWRADLRGAYLPNLDFTGADLSGSALTYSFGSMLAFQFDPNNQLLVAELQEGRLRIWHVADRAILREWSTRGLDLHTLFLSPDCQLLAGIASDYTIHLFDCAAGCLLFTLAGHHSPIWRLRFSAEGRLLISGDAGGRICIWDCGSGQLVQSLTIPDMSITALAIAPDGGRLAGATVDGTIYLWEIAEGTLLHSWRGHAEEVAALEFALIGTRLASGSHDATVRLWEAPSGRLLHVLQGHIRSIRDIATTPAGQILASGGGDPFVYLWDLERGVALHILSSHASALDRLLISPDGRWLATVDLNAIVSLWDTLRGQRVDFYPIHRDTHTLLDFAPDGQRLVSGGYDSALYLWDLRPAPEAQVIARMHGHRQRVMTVAFHPDGQTIASGALDCDVYLWDSHNARRWRTLSGHSASILCVSFNPSGTLLASSSDDSTIVLWSVADGQRLRVLRGHTNGLKCGRFSPLPANLGQEQPQLLASGGLDNVLRLWDVESGELLHTLQGHTNSITDCLFSGDGRHLLSAGYDQTLRLWETGSGQLLATWPTGDAVYLTLALHPNNRVVAAGGNDNLIHLLDFETGRMLGELAGHSRHVLCVRFSPTGQILASTSGDGAIKLWDTCALEMEAARDRCLQTLQSPGPYMGMNITGVTGISGAQREALKALGAVKSE